MLQNLIIFVSCIAAIKATGEFTILNAPKSLLLDGKDPIQSDDVGQVVYASLGNPIAEEVQWPVLKIADPFKLPQFAIAVSLYGVRHSKVSAAVKTYAVKGNTVEQSLNSATAQLEAHNEPVCAMSFKQLEEGKLSLKNIIGDVNIPPTDNTTYLNGGLHTADKQFLESISYVKAVADNMVNLKKSCNFVYISLFIEPVANAHGENSEAVNEALELFNTAVKNLNTEAQKSSNNEAFFVVAVNKADEKSRVKRDSPDEKDQYNLAEYYNEDYPVIFNIILWFMVIFGFSLLAIAYAIGSMDPGRDSIIYRMTSTRIKKDN